MTIQLAAAKKGAAQHTDRINQQETHDAPTTHQTLNSQVSWRLRRSPTTQPPPHLDRAETLHIYKTKLIMSDIKRLGGIEHRDLNDHQVRIQYGRTWHGRDSWTVIFVSCEDCDWWRQDERQEDGTTQTKRTNAQ